MRISYKLGFLTLGVALIIIMATTYYFFRKQEIKNK
jgi:hypothetical protein